MFGTSVTSIKYNFSQLRKRRFFNAKKDYLHASDKEKVDLNTATPAQLERVKARAKQSRFEESQKKVLAFGFALLLTAGFIWAFLLGFNYLFG